ncbi:pentapeptide repeat-containing protein [Streptomyces sp. enrichment culture]|uniref:pentapeptide repeat-containing protein n=1 Tax=Streptomyces sp. enrichment culture TaxID=1795815 RepID=UPI003F5533D1
MATTPPRRSGRSGRLQRVALRRTRARVSPRRLAVPLGPRPPARRRTPALIPAGRQQATAVPTDRWTRFHQAAGTLAALGTLAVIVFTWLSLQQVDNEHALTREGQVTDRYNAAVTNIGDDSLAVRVGGIYALQRIMQDSPRDQPAIINVLSTYIRTHAKQPKPDSNSPTQPASDVQAALTALGSRNPTHDGTAHIDLTGANLTGANLTGADLTRAVLSGADLTRADLAHADLKDANVTSVNLTRAYLSFANLVDANLTGADLTSANLSLANLTNANLTIANLTDAGMIHADLTSASLYSADLTNANLTGANLTGANLKDANLTGVKR